MLPVWQAGLLAALGATCSNLMLALIFSRILKAPPTFAPLTPLPVILGSVVGTLGATGVYALLTKPSLIYGITAILLLASAYMPLRLLQKRPRRTNRFDGANPALVASLFVLHTVVAGWSLAVLRFWLP